MARDNVSDGRLRERRAELRAQLEERMRGEARAGPTYRQIALLADEVDERGIAQVLQRIASEEDGHHTAIKRLLELFDTEVSHRR